MEGLIYILINKSVPSLVKIGRTSRDTHIRAAELSRDTGVPGKWERFHDWRVEDSIKIEHRIFKSLRPFRDSKNKEFFKLSPEDAKSKIHGLLLQWGVINDAPVNQTKDRTQHGPASAEKTASASYVHISRATSNSRATTDKQLISGHQTLGAWLRHANLTTPEIVTIDSRGDNRHRVPPAPPVNSAAANSQYDKACCGNKESHWQEECQPEINRQYRSTLNESAANESAVPVVFKFLLTWAIIVYVFFMLVSWLGQNSNSRSESNGETYLKRHADVQSPRLSELKSSAGIDLIETSSAAANTNGASPEPTLVVPLVPSVQSEPVAVKKEIAKPLTIIDKTKNPRATNKNRTIIENGKHNSDVRHCLSLSTNEEISKCAAR